MAKSKRIKDEGLDRLSALPDIVILNILSFMAMTDAVKTTILSKRWKNLWTTTPGLMFDDFERKIDDTDDLFLNRVRNFIKWALIFWRGSRIECFKIDFGTLFDNSIYSDVDLLLHFATKFQVELLGVFLLDVSISTLQELYWVPQCLYSCSSLKLLSLQGCKFHIPIKNVHWNQLKFLSIDVYGPSEDLINKVLSGSPQLVVLILYLCENNDNLTIKSNSLEHLHIEKFHDTDNPYVDTELRISTPNLHWLHIGGLPYSKCLMNNVPSLTRATLFFGDGPLYYSHEEFSVNDVVGETLRQILPTIQHVEELELSDWCIKALGDVKNKNMLLPLPKVKELELKGYFEDYKQIVFVLEIFPELETLVLTQEKASKKFRGNQHRHGIEPVMCEANFPDSFLQKLRTIVITLVEGEESVLPLIEMLLKYTSKLKKMVLRVKETAPPSNSLLLPLLKMPRSSPAAEVIISTIPDV